MVPKKRIYISAPYSVNLDEHHRSVKKHLIQRLLDKGYDLQEFSDRGLAKGKAWTFENTDAVMRRCQGAVIMVLPRFVVIGGDQELRFPTEANHFEGALAVAHRVPRLILVAEGIAPRGIASPGSDMLVHLSTSPDWVAASRFEFRFAAWQEQVERRQDVFLGYCSEAKAAANAVHLYLTKDLGVSVRDWAMDFRSGGTIMGEVERAVEECRAGIFLFTKSDPLEGRAGQAAPRDNVVLEAGYFMRAKGGPRTLIIREKGAKMPADLGGYIYLELPDRDNIATIETGLRKFVDRL